MVTGVLRFPKISIITPSYNQAQFLKETIQSVISQHYLNLEYIIIDGGSTDGSVGVIESYDEELAYWVSEPDRGQCHAINKGFARATGEIVSWLNSDDLLLPGALAAVARAFMEKPEAVVAVGACRNVDVDRIPLGLYEPRLPLPGPIVRGEWILGQPAVFFRQRVVDEIGPLDEQLHYVLDWEYWLRIGSYYSSDKMLTLESVLAESRKWPGAKTSSGVVAGSSEKRAVLDRFFDGTGQHRLDPTLKRIAYSRTYWSQGVNQLLSGHRGPAMRSLLYALSYAPMSYSFLDICKYTFTLTMPAAIVRPLKRNYQRFISRRTAN